MNRFLLPALGLLALAAPLAGCDLTQEQDEVFTGPTVQFGETNITATEGDTLEIPVTLSGATPGQTVTVDILFAAASSSACAEGDVSADSEQTCRTQAPDLTGFGTASTNSNRVQTVSITAGEDGTGTAVVTALIPDEEVFESAQTAVFALQNVPSGVRVGTSRELTLVIGTLPLATIRQFPDNTPATVEGIVTRVRGRFVYLQDETAGIVIFTPAGQPLNTAVAAGQIQEGDRIQVKGVTDIFRGLYEISFVTSFAVIGPDEGLPEPQTVTLAQIAANVDAYESELLTISGLTFNTSDVVFSGNTNYTVTDASGTSFILRVPNAPDSNAPTTPIPTGPTTFTGVLGQFDATGQLTLVNRSDLNP